MAPTSTLNGLETAVAARLAALSSARAHERIWSKDPTLWKADPALGPLIENRLGWLDAVTFAKRELHNIKDFAMRARSAGYQHAVLLGMGGSSLAPEVFKLAFGAKAGLDLSVLDSTDPSAVRAAAKDFDPYRTLCIVSSKSGTTVEVLCFLSHFQTLTETGTPFVAITDPATPLQELAAEGGFRKVFQNPADIGGRYSALSFFGLVPAALLGVNLDKLLASAAAMQAACGRDVSAESNPGFQLGAFMGEAALSGRDKLTLVLEPALAPFGAWVEQLVAESTGKEGRGLLPVDGEPLFAPEAYGTDRCFVYMTLKDQSPTLSAQVDALAAAGHPVARIEVDGLIGLGGEFMRWEIATAVAGMVLGVNPFDEPDVRAAKDFSGRVLEAYAKNGKLPEPAPIAQEGKLRLYGDEAFAKESAGKDLKKALAAHFARAKAGDYHAVLAYLPAKGTIPQMLAQLRAAVPGSPKTAATLGLGPRYLHSTGQYHKGGPDNGLFLVLTSDDLQELSIKGRGFGFSTLKNAQALGDLQALAERGRRYVRLHLGSAPEPALAELLQALKG